MPNDLRSMRAAAPSSAIDDALALLQVEDFSELPPPISPTLPFSNSGRLQDKRRSRAFRPVLQRQKAVLCIEDLHAEGLDSSPGPIVRSFPRSYRRTASLDYPPKDHFPSPPPAFLTSNSLRSLGPQRGDNATPDEASEVLHVRIVRPSRGSHWPY